jgi:hypothetical protein
VRSVGIGVMLNSRTGFPSRSRTYEPAGTRTSIPGMCGVFTDTASVVDNGVALSRTGRPVDSLPGTVPPAVVLVVLKP